MTAIEERPDISEQISPRPDRAEHSRRWRELAAAIAAEAGRITDEPGVPVAPESAGQLTVLGSGIESVGFSSADEGLITAADKVFYCVADPATAVWLKERRPDAYDLYVLYDDAKLRHVTYMQMTEAMLHFVRAGQHVVAVFYGHPGIFVLSTHRAIQIARREGHRAVMRAGVSALDAMCADLGFDPSQPGLLTYEATDMLVRRRRPDPALHVVLWQVGLIGELGYRRQGFLNSGFSLLLDHLEQVYASDQRVVNYVGSRYPGIPPLIEAHTIAELREPSVQATVTGLSTFYLAPVHAPAPDEAVLVELGLLEPGQRLKPPAGPLRVIDRYSPRERKAFTDYARFRVPPGYHWQEDTGAARFLLAMRTDAELRERYERDPAAALDGWTGALLTSRERTLLARREAGAVQLAAKGAAARTAPDSARLIRGVLSSTAVSRDLTATLTASAGADQAEVLRRWAERRGWRIDPSTLSQDLDRTLRSSLAPWSGLYLHKGSGRSVFLLGRPGKPELDRVYLDGVLVPGASYASGAVRWRTPEGNAFLQTDLARGARRLVGFAWPAGRDSASTDRIEFAAHRLPAATPQVPPTVQELVGSYRVRLAGAGVVGLDLGDPLVTVAGQQPAEVHWTEAGIGWTGGPPELERAELRAVRDRITGAPMLFGSGRAAGARSGALTGMVPIDSAGQARLSAEPHLGVPGWAWPHLVALTAQASQTGGLFVHNAWSTAVRNLRSLRFAAAEVER